MRRLPNPAEYLRRPNPARQKDPTIAEKVKFVDLVISTVLQGPDREYAHRMYLREWQDREKAILSWFKLCNAALESTKSPEAWSEDLVIGTVQRVLPIGLRIAGMEIYASSCELVKTVEQAEVAARQASENAARFRSRGMRGAEEASSWAERAARYIRENTGPWAAVRCAQAAIAVHNMYSWADDNKDVPLYASINVAFRAYREHT